MLKAYSNYMKSAVESTEDLSFCTDRNFSISTSVTGLGDLLQFGWLFEVNGDNNFAKIDPKLF